MTTTVIISRHLQDISILNRADFLLKQLTRSKAYLDPMSPVDQCMHVKQNKVPYEGAELLKMTKILKNLQNGVYTHCQIPFNEQKLISEKLKTSASLFDSIYGNCVYAQHVLELSKTCSQIFQEENRGNIDPKEVKDLQARVIALKSKHGINLGNKNALEEIEKTILTGIESGQVNFSSITFRGSSKPREVNPQTKEISIRLQEIETSQTINKEDKQKIFSSILRILDEFSHIPHV